VVDDLDGCRHGGVEIGCSPISRQRRVKHVSEPVNDHGLAYALKNPAVDFFIVVWGPRHSSQCARSHQDNAATHGLDRFNLFFVRTDHIVEIARLRRIELVCSAAGKHQPVARSCRSDRPFDEFKRCRPIHTHATLRSIHRFRDTKTETPKVLTVGNGLIPVDCTIEPGVVVGEGVGDDMCRRESDAIELALRTLRKMSGLGKMKFFDTAAGERQIDRESLETVVDAVHGWSLILTGQECRPSGALSSSWSHIPPVAALWRLRAAYIYRVRPRRD